MATVTKPILLDETGKQIVEALNKQTEAITSKGIMDIISTQGLSHNSIYRGKSFGTFASVSAVQQFLNDHDVSTGLFKDLYIGDYFKIQDGTYNVEWEIAGFDTYLHKGDSDFTTHHLALIP